MKHKILRAAWIIVLLNLLINTAYIMANLQTYLTTPYGKGLLVGELLYYASVFGLVYYSTSMFDSKKE